MGADLAITVHSHHERAEVLADTLKHLAELGLPRPSVSVQVTPPDPARNRLNARDALQKAWPWPAGGVLMLEDDVRLDADIHDWIAVARALGRTTFFYSAYVRNHPGWFFAAHTQTPELMPPFARGLYRLERPPELWGAQAVYLPRSVLALMWQDERLHSEELDGSPIDDFFRRFFTSVPKSQLPYLALPNPVEHLAPLSVVNKDRRQHYSISRPYAHLATGEGVTING